MANIRRGFSDDFVVKNNKVGINTAEPQVTLDVKGTIKATNLKTSGITTVSSYEGFLNQDQNILESTTIKGGSSLSGEIIVGTGVTITVDSIGITTALVGVGTNYTGSSNNEPEKTIEAGGSQIESLKVYNTFTPPSGGTNERPDAPKPGELYYNYDFKTIEFFDGYGWKQVDNTTRSSRAVISSGYDAASAYSGKYDYITITTLGNSAYFGDMQTALRDKQGCGSAIRALFGGGASPGGYENEIDYLTIASAGNGVDFGNLTAANLHNSALSSSTRAIWGGGYGPAFTNVIEYVEINTLGNALDFGDLSGDMDEGTAYHASFASPTRGVFACGTHPTSPAGDNVIRSAESITIASKGNSTRFGDLTAKHQRPSAASNGIKGLVFSGRDIPDISEISMTSGGVGIHFGNLSDGDYSGFSACNAIRAVHGGGEPGAGGRTNRIEYVTMTTGGNSQDFGDLSFAESFLTATSDSHGGLGGF
jgi:hypothetical protein